MAKFKRVFNEEIPDVIILSTGKEFGFKSKGAAKNFHQSRKIHKTINLDWLNINGFLGFAGRYGIIPAH